MADDGNDENDYAAGGEGEGEGEGEEEPGRAAAVADAMRSKASEAMGMFSASSKGVQIAIVGGAVVLIALLVWFIRRRRQEARAARFLGCGGCVHRFRNSVVECTNNTLNDRNLQERPRNSSCTYSLWMNVRQWNAVGWKSVFYKGKGADAACPSIQWDTVKNQCPGIWLTRGENNVRIAVVTFVDTGGCQGTGGGTKRPEWRSGQWRATEMRGRGADCGAAPCSTHADAATEALNHCKKKGSDAEVNIIEYADVQNIPIGEWFMLSVVMTQRRFEAYVNGKLWLTKVLLGTPEYNTDGVHFGAGNTGGVTMSNFRYMPHALPSFMVEYLYNQEYGQSFRKRTTDGDHDY